MAWRGKVMFSITNKRALICRGQLDNDISDSKTKCARLKTRKYRKKERKEREREPNNKQKKERKKLKDLALK